MDAFIVREFVCLYDVYVYILWICTVLRTAVGNLRYAYEFVTFEDGEVRNWILRNIANASPFDIKISNCIVASTYSVTNDRVFEKLLFEIGHRQKRSLICTENFMITV